MQPSEHGYTITAFKRIIELTAMNAHFNQAGIADIQRYFWPRPWFLASTMLRQPLLIFSLSIFKMRLLLLSA
jgi:hypothetical protein